MLGDLRGIFLTAESALLEERFRPHCNLVNLVNPVVGYKRVKNSSELKSYDRMRIIRIEFSLGKSGDIPFK